MQNTGNKSLTTIQSLYLLRFNQPTTAAIDSRYYRLKIIKIDSTSTKLLPEKREKNFFWKCSVFRLHGVYVVVERRRRDKINAWVSHLAELVPECSPDIKLTEVSPPNKTTHSCVIDCKLLGLVAYRTSTLLIGRHKRHPTCGTLCISSPQRVSFGDLWRTWCACSISRKIDR